MKVRQIEEKNAASQAKKDECRRQQQSKQANEATAATKKPKLASIAGKKNLDVVELPTAHGIKQIRENFANLFLSHARKSQSNQNITSSSAESTAAVAASSSSSLSSSSNPPPLRLGVVEEDLNILKTIEYETNKNQEKLKKTHATNTATPSEPSTKKATTQSFQFLKSKPPLS